MADNEILIAYEELQRDVEDVTQYGVRVGSALRKIAQHRQYRDLGFPTFGEFCESIGISPITAYALMRAAFTIDWLAKHEKYHKYAELLEHIGASKLTLLSWAIREQVVSERLLEQAKTLSYHQLRREIRKLVYKWSSVCDELVDEIVEDLRTTATRCKDEPYNAKAILGDFTARLDVWLAQLGNEGDIREPKEQ